MASIALNRKNGTRRIYFRGKNKANKIIYLGDTPKRVAERVLSYVEDIIACNLKGVSVSRETAEWLGGIDEQLYTKLVNVGLVPKRAEPEKFQLEAFLNGYTSNRGNVKPSTMTNWNHTVRNLVDFFGKAKPIDEINEGQAEDFERYLKTTARSHAYGDADKSAGLAPATVRKRIGNAKQFFDDAKKRKLIASNPFEELDSAVRSNKSREYFVSRADSDKILAVLPDNEWKLIYSLSRYGGFRCPSEHVSLKWTDVDLERGRMTVRSPKTEHHEGKESREVPIFPELRPYLENARAEAKPDAVYVISSYRQANANLRTQLVRYIKLAGLKPWPKLFQNLRSTRETELCDEFPIHVVCQWIGNSQAVAKKHYLQTTDQHFEKAVYDDANSDGNDATETTPNATSRLAAILGLALTEFNISHTSKQLGQLMAKHGRALHESAREGKWAIQDSNL